MEIGKKIPLSEYLANIQGPFYIYNYPERLLLAQDIFDAIDEKLNADHNIKRHFDFTLFLNPDEIELELVNSNYYCGYRRFKVTINDFDIYGNATFTNYKYINPQALEQFRGQALTLTNGKISRQNTYNENKCCKTIATILFEIILGVHPFCGMEYFKRQVHTKEFLEQFFSNKPRFIFDLADNPNRFLNGYHEKAYQLWKMINENQRQLIVSALNNQYGVENDKGDNQDLGLYTKFKNEWMRLFKFEFTKSYAPCGLTIPTLYFSDGNALLVTELQLSENKSYCYLRFKSVKKLCKACTFDDPFAEPFTNDLEIINKADPSKSHILKVFEDKKLHLKDIDGTTSERNIFEVVKSKKVKNIMGLRILVDEEFIGEQNGSKKKFTKGAVIPLLPDFIIHFSSDIEIKSLVKRPEPEVKPVAKQEPKLEPEVKQEPKLEPEVKQEPKVEPKVEPEDLEKPIPKKRDGVIFIEEVKKPVEEKVDAPALDIKEEKAPVKRKIEIKIEDAEAHDEPKKPTNMDVEELTK